jgi:deoxycytidylate deaminase
MQEVAGGSFLRGLTKEDDRIWQHMDAGDAIRHQTRRNDAIAGLALGYISEYREEHFGAAPALATAFILDSLKHPAEIESLRQIYRDRLIVISVHSPTEARLKALTKKIAGSYGKPERAKKFEVAAKRIMRRDEHDDDREFGQNVREAFTAGDVYVSTHPEPELEGGVARFLRLFFGDPFLTPSRDEYAMFQTHAAALRSADLSRQVGAAVCTSDGEIIAVGCNEVPRAFGGQYWPDDEPDQRDFQLGYDSNVKYRDEALRATFERLKKHNQLSDLADLAAFTSAVGGTRFGSITEFGRTMHAEMATLLDAARRGTAVAGQRLFTTTFPCHNCARHIIGAGIKEVVYREPYEKSVASDLHEDAVVVDPAGPVDDKVVIRRFVGVGPPRYLDLFSKPTRKDSDGNRIDWSETLATPRLVRTETAYITNEEDFLDEFRESIALVDLTRRDDDC